MTTGRVIAALPLAALLIAAPATAEEMSLDVAVLQGLDKVVGRVMTIEAPIGVPVRFGTLQIVAATCRKRPPEEPPESAAYLEITETRPGEASQTRFKGWMFASSPALSAMEHPVYDVWVLDCKATSSGTSSTR